MAMSSQERTGQVTRWGKHPINAAGTGFLILDSAARWTAMDCDGLRWPAAAREQGVCVSGWLVIGLEKSRLAANRFLAPNKSDDIGTQQSIAKHGP